MSVTLCWVVGVRLRRPRLPLYSAGDRECHWLDQRGRWTKEISQVRRFGSAESALALAKRLGAKILCIRDRRDPC